MPGSVPHVSFSCSMCSLIGVGVAILVLMKRGSVGLRWLSALGAFRILSAPYFVWGDDVVGAVARFGIHFRLASGSRPFKFAEYLFLMYF